MKKNYLDIVKILVISTILLILTSFYYDYSDFYVFALFSLYLLALGTYFRKHLQVIIGVGVIFYLFFLIFNINYVFMLGICIVLGLFIYNMIKPELEVNKWIYSLIALFLLLHVVWFNVLPFGYSQDYNLNDDSQYFSLENFGKKNCDENNNCYYILEKDYGYIIFHSPFVMKNAMVNVTIEGEGISLAPKSPDILNVNWTYNWNFEKY